MINVPSFCHNVSMSWNWQLLQPKFVSSSVKHISLTKHHPLFIKSIFCRSACYRITRNELFRLMEICQAVGLIFKMLGRVCCRCRFASDCRYRVVSSIPAWSNTFVDIDHEIISTAILLPSVDSRRVVVSYMRNYVHEVLVNRLVKLTRGRCG